MKTMKGVVISGKGKMEVSDQCPLPELSEIVPTGAIVKPMIWSPCTTDVHICKTGCAAFPYMLGKASGHEMAGIVEAVGPEVRDVKPGDRVIVDPIMPHWRSMAAQDGAAKWDVDDLYRGIDYPDRGGSFVEHYYIRDADMNLTPIPDNVTWEQAIMVPDMMNTPLTGVTELNPKFGDSIAIIGIGPVGLMALRGCVLKGAGKVFAVGSRKVTFDIAKEFGATACFDYHDENWAEQIIEANGGKLLDGVMVAGGRTSLIGTGLRMLKHTGTLVNLAAFFEDEALVISTADWDYGYGDKTIKGVCVSGGKAWLSRMVALIAEGRVQPERLITHKFHGLEEIPKAVQLFMDLDRTLVKPVIYND